MNHPWLLDEFAEEVSSLAFDEPDFSVLRDELISLHAEGEADPAAIAQHFARANLSAMAARVDHALMNHVARNFALDAEKEEVLAAWRHVLMLHNRASALNRELREAEDDYFREQSAQNFARLCAIRQQLEIAIPVSDAIYCSP